MHHPDQVLSHDQLLKLVWGDPYGVSRDQVKLYVGYLRSKLVPDAPAAPPIETVRGFGYRYRGLKTGVGGVIGWRPAVGALYTFATAR